VALRILFALVTVQLLQIGGILIVAGGLLLLYVCWRMWRDLRAGHSHLEDEAQAEAGFDGTAAIKPAKTFKQAFFTIFIADVSMSLDNVLAVAGAAKDHPTVLIIGLLLSIILMGVAATWIAKLLHRFPIIGYIGLIIVLLRGRAHDLGRHRSGRRPERRSPHNRNAGSWTSRRRGETPTRRVGRGALGLDTLTGVRFGPPKRRSIRDLGVLDLAEQDLGA
jgi:YjbE family integral membrane protein